MFFSAPPIRIIFRRQQQKQFNLAEKPKIPSDITCIVLLDPARKMVLEGIEAHFQKKVICITDPRKALQLIPKTGKCVLITGHRLKSLDKWDGYHVACKAQEKNGKTKVLLVSSITATEVKKENEQSPFSQIIYLPKEMPSEKRTKKMISLIKKCAA